jgi:hypothetical protein
MWRAQYLFDARPPPVFQTRRKSNCSRVKTGPIPAADSRLPACARLYPLAPQQRRNDDQRHGHECVRWRLYCGFQWRWRWIDANRFRPQIEAAAAESLLECGPTRAGDQAGSFPSKGRIRTSSTASLPHLCNRARLLIFCLGRPSRAIPSACVAVFQAGAKYDSAPQTSASGRCSGKPRNYISRAFSCSAHCGFDGRSWTNRLLCRRHCGV